MLRQTTNWSVIGQLLGSVENRATYVKKSYVMAAISSQFFQRYRRYVNLRYRLGLGVAVG